MPDDQTSTPKSTKAPATDTQAPTPWFAAIDPGMAVWAKSNAALLAGMRDLAETVNLFSQTRLRANIDACKSLSSCQDPATLVGLQREYVENAMTQYREHTKTMAEQTGTMIAAAKSPAAKS